MILTEKKYREDLWDIYFKPLTSETMPSYDDYVIRENMLEDYLDIFRGKNTRVVRAYGAEKDHPFLKYLGDKQDIKYILIAEAANGFASYIYNINRTNKSGYFTAPLDAFGYESDDELHFLASKGVLILDLFPFSMSYSTSLRGNFNSTGVTKSFFDDPLNPYSIINRINELKMDKDICLDLDKTKPNACFIAPPTISHYLAGLVNTHGSCSLLNFRLGVNSFCPPSTPPLTPYPLYLKVPSTSSTLEGIGGIIYVLTGLAKVPTFSCSAYSGSGLVPHCLFIKSALGL